jgi:hypothetical protein
MLNRSQLYALLLARKHSGNLFSAVPRDLIALIGSYCENPRSDISTLLYHIANAHLLCAEAMLELNPRLVLQAGNVVTPSGLKVVRTTPLECALGAGDPEMVRMIEPHFESDRIEGGAIVREEQYARYRPHIENMLKQKPYDFTLLLTTIKEASSRDVSAALNNNTLHASLLRDVLAQFRKEFTPGKITVGMHFNYQDLMHACEVFYQKYDYLLNDDDDSRNCLFSRQVIGFIQRNLPAIDRMAYAQGLHEIVEMKAAIKRSLKFSYDRIDFPDTGRGAAIHSGLGYSYFCWTRGACYTIAGPEARERWPSFGKLISDKNLSLAKLVQPHQEEKKTSGCVIC